MTEYIEKKKMPSNQASLYNEKLYIKGVLQTQYQPISLPQITASYVLEDPSIPCSDPEEHGGCIFQGYSANVTSLKDVSGHNESGSTSSLIHSHHIRVQD